VILFVVISIDYYLMTLLFLEILDRIKKDLEKGSKAERTRWRHGPTEVRVHLGLQE
jgi:hypothetical protein